MNRYIPTYLVYVKRFNRHTRPLCDVKQMLLQHNHIGSNPAINDPNQLKTASISFKTLVSHRSKHAQTNTYRGLPQSNNCRVWHCSTMIRAPSQYTHWLLCCCALPVFLYSCSQPSSSQCVTPKTAQIRGT